MTGNALRRARLMRVRSIEHRLASAQLTQANIKLSQLTQVNDRIGALRIGLNPAQGNTTGLSLKSNAEMAQRLDLASASMAVPIEDAQEQCSVSNAQRIKAQQSEDSATKLYDRAVMDEDQVRTLRADANRPFRKPLLMLGEGA